MSDYTYPSAVSSKDQHDFLTALDWSNSTPIYAPHPEAFDADLDAVLSSTGLVDNSIDLLRTLTQSFERTAASSADDIHRRAIPSTFSFSTESAATASASGYGDSEYYSTHNQPTSPLFSFNFNNMDLQNPAIDTQSLFPEAEMMNLAAAAAAVEQHESYQYPSPPPSASPAHISPNSLPSPESYQTESADSTRRFKCVQCSRAFARQYNLKTHMETHSTNRIKAHVCQVKSCKRAFSRKHDLGRHMTAIHGDHPAGPSTRRQRCDECGKAWTGRERSCGCDEYK